MPSRSEAEDHLQHSASYCWSWYQREDQLSLKNEPNQILTDLKLNIAAPPYLGTNMDLSHPSIDLQLY